MLNRILKNEHYRKYFYNTGWLLSEKIIRIIATIVVGILVARYLGPERYGLLNYALSLIAIFTVISGLGLGDILVREFVRKNASPEEMIGTTLGLKLLSSSILTVSIIGWMYFSNEEPILKVLTIIISSTMIFQSFDVLERYFQANVKAKTTVKAYIVALLVSSIFKAWLVYIKASLIYFGIAQASESLILAMGLIYFYYSHSNSLKNLRFKTYLGRSYLRESGALVISSLTIILYMRIDQIMIKNLLDAKSLGNFSAAVKLSESYYFIPVVIVNSLFPAIIYGKSIGEKEFNKRMQKLFALLTWIAIPIACCVSLIANPLAHFLLPKFEQVGPVLSLHIWAGLFAFWGTASVKWFVVEGIPRYITFGTFLGCCINITLNFFFIPNYGIIGAAAATLISQSIAVFLNLIIFKKTRPLFFIMLGSLNVLSVVQSLQYFLKLKKQTPSNGLG